MGGTEWIKAFIDLCRDVIVGASREAYLRLLVLLFVVATLIVLVHAAGVPMPWE